MSTQPSNMLTYQGLLSPLASPQAAVVSVATAVPGGRRGAGGRRGTAANDTLRNVVCRSPLRKVFNVMCSVWLLVCWLLAVSFRFALN